MGSGGRKVCHPLPFFLLSALFLFFSFLLSLSLFLSEVTRSEVGAKSRPGEKNHAERTRHESEIAIRQL